MRGYKDELELCSSLRTYPAVYDVSLNGDEETKAVCDDVDGKLHQMEGPVKDGSTMLGCESRNHAWAVDKVHDDVDDSDSASNYSGDHDEKTFYQKKGGDDEGAEERSIASSVRCRSGWGNGIRNEIRNGTENQSRSLSPGHCLSVALRKFCVENGVAIERRGRWR
ncbi:hypothetical protein BD289DRAFT_166558 [Coniella lustricola]|uniref:Uncharacterized protein n=1 Tax=Coniella lustricola TaxID=2025994 RepID=A0A2T3AE99_9PEZI|nr:hypothetical protein BD289DRAFT_166558 [Coniella lustricola]